MASRAKTEIAILAERIAAVLGAGYHAEGPRDGEYWDHGHGILGPNGQRLFLAVTTYGRDRGRLSVSGGFPPNTFGLEPCSRLKIGVGSAATPSRIAREILRRLLPAYAAALQDYQRRVAEAARAEGARDQLAEELGASLPGGAISRPSKGQFSVEFDEEVGGPSLEVRVFDGGDRVNLRIDRLTAEQARALLAWARAALAMPPPDATNGAEKSKNVPTKGLSRSPSAPASGRGKGL